MFSGGKKNAGFGESKPAFGRGESMYRPIASGEGCVFRYLYLNFITGE
jgi:hypothetical protein